MRAVLSPSFGRAFAVLVAAGLPLAHETGRADGVPNEVQAHRTQPAKRRESVLIAGEIFNLELALTPKQRTRGLMWRRDIPADGGMLFVFPTARARSFWMAHTLVDLDLVFLDAQGEVTSLHRMKAEDPQGDSESSGRYRARLSHYSSRRPVQFAIELKAGTLEFLCLVPGETVKLDFPSLRALAK